MVHQMSDRSWAMKVDQDGGVTVNPDNPTVSVVTYADGRTWSSLRVAEMGFKHPMYFHTWENGHPHVRVSNVWWKHFYNAYRWCLEHWWRIRGVKWYG